MVDQMCARRAFEPMDDQVQGGVTEYATELRVRKCSISARPMRQFVAVVIHLSCASLSLGQVIVSEMTVFSSAACYHPETPSGLEAAAVSTLMLRRLLALALLQRPVDAGLCG